MHASVRPFRHYAIRRCNCQLAVSLVNFLDAALVNKRTLLYTRPTLRFDRRIETRSQYDTIVPSTRIRTLAPETTRVRGNTKTRWSSNQRGDYRSIENKNIALGYIIAIFLLFAAIDAFVDIRSQLLNIALYTRRYTLTIFATLLIACVHLNTRFACPVHTYIY